MTARATFREGDLRRAIRVAQSEGIQIAGVEINDNGAHLIFGDPNTRPRKRVNMADKLYGPQA